MQETDLLGLVEFDLVMSLVVHANYLTILRDGRGAWNHCHCADV